MRWAIQNFHYFTLHLIALSTAIAAPPANDRFDNRTRLEGTRVEIVGTFNEAAAEPGEPVPCCGGWNTSVWWSWKAPETGLVLVEAGEKSRAYGSLYITTATNLADMSAQEEFVTVMPISQKRYATFQAVAGKEYQIGAFGYGSPLELRLALTNTPIILEGPESQGISPGGPIFLSVAVAMVENNTTRIQWQFEGSDITYETGSVVLRTNSAPEISGAYRAIVSSTDSFGNVTVRTSGVAQVTVSVAESPRLEVSKDPASGGVSIRVAGELRRSWWLARYDSVERMPDLIVPFSVSDLPLQLFANRKNEFFRVRLFEPQNPTCWLNLRRIYFAKERLAADMKMRDNAAFAMSLLQSQMGYIPECPQGGIYTYSSIDVYPTCSVAGHVLVGY